MAITAQKIDGRQSWQDIVTPAHLQQIFAVLEAVQNAATGERLKESVIEALATVFGVRNVTFFFGPTYTAMFEDPDPLLLGIPQSLLRDYQDRWVDKDIFAFPRARRILAQRGFTTLDELADLPAPQESYVQEHLAPHDVSAASALHLRFADGEAILGMFDKSRDWSRPETLVMQLLAKHLRASCRSIALGEENTAQDVSAVLSPRQLEVAELISDGLTNAAIAERLGVTEMTVKKYVSRIFEATGMSNRSMLTAGMLRCR